MTITHEETSGALFPHATPVVYADKAGTAYKATYLRPHGSGHRISIERPAPGGFRKEVRHVRANRISRGDRS